MHTYLTLAQVIHPPAPHDKRNQEITMRQTRRVRRRKRAAFLGLQGETVTS